MTPTYQFVKVPLNELIKEMGTEGVLVRLEGVIGLLVHRVDPDLGDRLRFHHRNGFRTLFDLSDIEILRPVPAPSQQEVEKEALEKYPGDAGDDDWLESVSIQGFREGYIAGRMANNQ